MRTLRLAMAQINTTVGDLEGNAQRILRAIDEARGHRHFPRDGPARLRGGRPAPEAPVRADGGGFSSAIRTQEAKDFLGMDGEVDFLHASHVAIELGKLSELNRRKRGGLTWTLW